MADKPSPWNGWRLTGLISTGLILMALVIALLAPTPVEGARLVIRTSARTSLLLFTAAFTASALARLAPSKPTRWLLANRRYLGVSFAVSHFVHAAAVIALLRLDRPLFLELTNTATYVGGGLVYVFIILMTATSFDGAAAWIGRRTWRWLHSVGAWYIWLIFAVSFGMRAPVNAMYYSAVAVVFLAPAVRITALLRRRARPGVEIGGLALSSATIAQSTASRSLSAPRGQASVGSL
jgi:hypothetical protein